MTNALLTTLSAADVRNYYAQGFWRAETIFGLVHDRAESSPDKVAVRERFRSITYGELIDAADRLAADLDRRGLCVGQRVAVWLPSRIETAVALLACSRNGYVCCPSLHREHTVGEIAKLLARIGAAVLIAAVDYGADSGRGEHICDRPARWKPCEPSSGLIRKRATGRGGPYSTRSALYKTQHPCTKIPTLSSISPLHREPRDGRKASCIPTTRCSRTRARWPRTGRSIKIWSSIRFRP